MRRAATACVLLAACSTPTTQPAFDNSDQAPLNLTFTTEPPAAPDGVALDATVVIVFDDFPDPDTVGFGPVLLRSGKANFDADMKVDLVHQSLRIRGKANFQPGTTYEVLLDPTVRGLDGRSSLDTVAFTFTTGTTRAGSTPRPPVTWADVSDFLATPPVPAGCDPLPQKGCAPVCHTPCGASGSLRAPTRRLDLSADPGDPIYGLINAPSVGLEGSSAQIPRVLPGDSARSMLVRKLLGGGQRPDPADQPYPDLRADGKRMPTGTCGDPTTPTDYFECPLPFDVIERIAQWIDDGAKR